MKHTIKGFVVHETWNHDRNGGTFRFQTSPSYKSGNYIQLDVCPLEIVFDVPDDFDSRSGKVAALRDLKVEMHGKFAAAVKELDDRINSLLALEMA